MSVELKLYPHGALAIGMLVAGSLNSIAYKVADWQTARGTYSPTDCDWSSPEPPLSPPSPPSLPRPPNQPMPPSLPPLAPPSAPPPPNCLFVHPFFQVYAMFLGECLCLLTFVILRLLNQVPPAKSFNPFVFLLPALCDTCGTSLMMLGLLLTYASVYQMLRGSVVVFTGIFSRIFLKRILNGNNWVGLFMVLCGTAVVGLDAVVNKQSSSVGASNPGLGNVLIVAAQVIVAVQMIIEEKFVGDKDIPPLLAVGCEGIFGMLILTGVMALAYFLKGVEGLSETPDHLDDVFDGLKQVFTGGNALLTVSMIAVVLSIAFFNFFGISVTKSLSAAHRMVLDSTRSVVVWIFSLTVSPPSGGPQQFSWMQLAGFVILIAGSLVYYEIISAPCVNTTKRRAATGNSSSSETPAPLDASLLPINAVQSDAPQTLEGNRQRTATSSR